MSSTRLDIRFTDTVFALADKRKNYYQHKLQEVKTIMGTSGCRMQQPNAGSTRHWLVRVCAAVQAAIGCCILLLLVPKMVLTLCNLCWWCFSYHQITQRPHLHLQCELTATCAGGFCLVPTSTSTKVHTELATMLSQPPATCPGGVLLYQPGIY